MDTAVLQELVKRYKACDTYIFTDGADGPNADAFDGSNAGGFAKCFLDIEEIYEAAKRDDRQAFWAASQLLKRSAINRLRDGCITYII